MDATDGTDPKDIVRRGYDAASLHHELAYDAGTKYAAWLEEIDRLLPDRGTVLDLGCGSGVPVARALAAAGHRVTGIDISEAQIRRARNQVPEAEFVRVDATAARFDDASFDAVVALYSLIHVPTAEQPPLLRSIARWLRPGGRLLATTGHSAWTGTEEDWLGSGAPMWWSHADAATYRAWITQAGLTVEREEFVPEGDGGHALFLARRPLEPAEERCTG